MQPDLREKGASTILFTLVILSVLSILAFTATLVVTSSIKTSKTLENSMQSFYGAESGMEEALYNYINQTGKNPPKDKQLSQSQTTYSYEAKPEIPKYIDPLKPLHLKSSPSKYNILPSYKKELTIKYASNAIKHAPVEISTLVINPNIAEPSPVDKTICTTFELRSASGCKVSTPDSKTKSHLFRIKPVYQSYLNPNIHKEYFDITLKRRASGGGLIDDEVENYFRITSVAKTQESYRQISAVLSIDPAPSSVFDYVIFSDESIIK